jgi:hypothetical protein
MHAKTAVTRASLEAVLNWLHLSDRCTALCTWQADMHAKTDVTIALATVLNCLHWVVAKQTYPLVTSQSTQSAVLFGNTNALSSLMWTCVCATLPHVAALVQHTQFMDTHRDLLGWTVLFVPTYMRHWWAFTNSFLHYSS